MVPKSAVRAEQATLTSTSLIHRMQLRDSEAWCRFVDLYSPLIWYWCRKLGLKPTDADDISQNVFAAVSESIGKYTRSGSFRGWLWQVTRNKMMDHFRKQHRSPKVVGGTDFGVLLQQVPQSEPTDLSERQTRDNLVVGALELIRQEFEESTWQAFSRMTLERKSAVEVAKELNWGTADDPEWKKGAKRVRQAKFRVMKRLREEFGDLLETDQ